MDEKTKSSVEPVTTSVVVTEEEKAGDVRHKFAAAIYQIRSREKLTLEQFAAKVSLSGGAVGKWELLMHYPTAPSFAKLVAVFPELDTPEFRQAVKVEHSTAHPPQHTSPRQAGRRHASPRFPPIKARHKPIPKVLRKVLKEVGPIHAKAQEPPAEEHSSLELDKLPTAVLTYVYHCVLGNTVMRSNLIELLHEAGYTDWMIVKVIHKMLM